jgi:hypothetical protein
VVKIPILLLSRRSVAVAVVAEIAQPLLQTVPYPVVAVVVQVEDSRAHQEVLVQKAKETKVEIKLLAAAPPTVAAAEVAPIPKEPTEPAAEQVARVELVKLQHSLVGPTPREGLEELEIQPPQLTFLRLTRIVATEVKELLRQLEPTDQVPQVDLELSWFVTPQLSTTLSCLRDPKIHISKPPVN